MYFRLLTLYYKTESSCPQVNFFFINRIFIFVYRMFKMPDFKRLPAFFRLASFILFPAILDKSWTKVGQIPDRLFHRIQAQSRQQLSYPLSRWGPESGFHLFPFMDNKREMISHPSFKKHLLFSPSHSPLYPVIHGCTGPWSSPENYDP